MLSPDSSVPVAPRLLVDGYNIIGAWHQFKSPSGKSRSGRVKLTQGSIFSNAEALDAARQHLIEVLMGYSAFQGYHTELVFDAYAREGGMGSTEQVGEHLAVSYTEAGQTADTYIEKVCAQNWYNRRQNVAGSLSRIIVATSDHAHKVTVLGYDAEWMSARRLHEDVQVVKHLIQQKQQSARAPHRRVLSHQLDPQAKARLEQLRFAKPTD
jgi:uncharacterized protein